MVVTRRLLGLRAAGPDGIRFKGSEGYQRSRPYVAEEGEAARWGALRRGRAWIMVPQMHGGRHRRHESGDMVARIEAQIRRALRYSAGTSALSRQSIAADPQRSERRRAAVRLIDERADLRVRVEQQAEGRGAGDHAGAGRISPGLVRGSVSPDRVQPGKQRVAPRSQGADRSARRESGPNRDPTAVDERLDALEDLARSRPDEYRLVSFMDRIHGGPENRRAHCGGSCPIRGPLGGGRCRLWPR